MEKIHKFVSEGERMKVYPATTILRARYTDYLPYEWEEGEGLLQNCCYASHAGELRVGSGQG